MRKNQGITLVALIITIVVMLILVGVSVNLIVNSNLIGEAEKAGATHENAVAAEQKLNPSIGETGKTVKDYLAEAGIIIPGNRVETNSKYNEVTIPVGFAVSGIKEEQSIEEGLVIYEIPEGVDTNAENFWTETTEVGEKSYPSVQCKYNQYVWVPVETAYVTAGELAEIISNSNGTITTEIEAMQSLVDAGTYPMAVQMPNGTDYRGILYDFSAGTNGVKITVQEFSTTANYDDGTVTYNREPAKLISTIASSVDQTKEQELDMQTEYNNIVKSVKAEGGFWVARYELSYNSETGKGESKRGKKVGIDSSITWYEHCNICKEVYQASKAGEKQSAMIYGSQWDQIMIWMKNVKNIQDESKYYIRDSSYMGNYRPLSGGTGIEQVSGYDDSYSVKKIFDLGGNLYDWTAEANGAYSRVLRGNDCNRYGSSYPASGRNSCYTGTRSDGLTDRATLYVSL